MRTDRENLTSKQKERQKNGTEEWDRNNYKRLKDKAKNNRTLLGGLFYEK